MASIIRAKIFFTRQLLATTPNNPNLVEEYIAKEASKEAREEEVAKMTEMMNNPDYDELFEKSMTIFYRDASGCPTLEDHTWKGYMKEKCKFIRQFSTRTSVEQDVYDGLFELHEGKITEQDVLDELIASGYKPPKKAEKPLSAGIKNFKQRIDGAVMIYPHWVKIHTNDDIDVYQRPLRADTPQGPRVALSASEAIQHGSWCRINIKVNIDENLDTVREWLNYGYAHGTGQWRNSGCGRFLWQELDREGNIIGGNFKPMLYAMMCEEDNRLPMIAIVNGVD